MRRSVIYWCNALLLIVALAVSGTTQALDFRLETIGEKTVLWVSDWNTNGKKVGGFKKGDGDKFRAAVRRGGYNEVWLNSGGGNVIEGIDIGRTLRANRQFVRVPKGAICASSCTIAFLGGVVRTVDPGSRFLVHVFSSLSDAESIENPMKEYAKAKDKPHMLTEYAKEIESGSYYLALMLFSYYQEMRGGRAVSVDDLLSIIAVDKIDNAYTSERNLPADLATIEREGEVAFQKILMDLEMRILGRVYDALKKHEQELGKGASEALAYLDRMLSSRIAGTAPLSLNDLMVQKYTNVPLLVPSQ